MKKSPDAWRGDHGKEFELPASAPESERGQPQEIVTDAVQGGVGHDDVKKRVASWWSGRFPPEGWSTKRPPEAG